MTNPLVTIAIPTYNGAKRICNSLDSVLNQDYKNLEILICDNASTDNTSEIVSTYMLKDNRIRYIRHEKNMGIIYNFNCIAHIAMGEYVIRFADDDILSDTYVSELVKSSIFYSNVIICAGKVVSLDESGRFLAEYTKLKHIKNTFSLSKINRIGRGFIYSHYRGWSWGIIYALTKRSALLSHPMVENVKDPGTNYVRNIIYEGDIVFNHNAIVYKKRGGISSIGKSVRFKDIISSIKDEFTLYKLSFEQIKSLNDNSMIDLIKLKFYLLFSSFKSINYLFKLSIWSFFKIILPYKINLTIRNIVYKNK